MIELGKKYETCDHRPVRILCTDAEGAHPVVGLLDGEVYRWRADGTRGPALGGRTYDDLIEVQTPEDVVREALTASLHLGEHIMAYNACRALDRAGYLREPE